MKPPPYCIAKGIGGNYGTAHVQVYKQTCVTHCALRNFKDNSRVGLMRHEDYTTRE